MRTYGFTFTGTQPLLLHHDDIEWADAMERWKDDKDNKAMSKAGDDRTPAYRWIGCLYRSEEGQIILPAENIMRAGMEGAAMVPVPGGRKGKTFKAQSQSGIIPRAIGWPLLVSGAPVPTKKIEPLLKENDFRTQMAEVKKIPGMSLFVKRAKVGSSKHIRVRPRFMPWSVSGEFVVTDEQITDDALSDIFEMAGRYKGLGDWRPGGKTPGTFGMFTSEVKRMK